MSLVPRRPVAVALTAGALLVVPAAANAFFLFAPVGPFPFAAGQSAVAAPGDHAISYPETRPSAPTRFRRQIVPYATSEPAGTVVIDTPNTYLYFVLGDGRAMRYGIGVGRDGFTWSGTQSITRKAEWPDWTPPPEMLNRQPYLPRFVAGGPNNPLGARALYLGDTIYRIHGTNQPETIGSRVSSGCIRMVNDDVVDLHARVKVGTKVVVLPGRDRAVSRRLGRRAAIEAPTVTATPLPASTFDHGS